jgi:hypothetical protein
LCFVLGFQIAEFATVLSTAESAKVEDPAASVKALAAELDAAVARDAAAEEAAERAKAAVGLKRKPASFRERKRQEAQGTAVEGAKASAPVTGTEEGGSAGGGGKEEEGAAGGKQGDGREPPAASDKAKSAAARGGVPTGPKERRTWGANFTGFLGLLAGKALREAKLSADARSEFEAGFALFVDDDATLDASGWPKHTVDVASVAVLCASLDHPLAPAEVAALRLASHRGACFKRLKKADKGQARAAAQDLADALALQEDDVDGSLGYVKAFLRTWKRVLWVGRRASLLTVFRVVFFLCMVASALFFWGQFFFLALRVAGF